MSNPRAYCRLMNTPSARYFMRKDEYAERTTYADSPFPRFKVSCLKCESVKLRMVGEFDTDAGELKVYLHCPSCRERELLPVC